LLHPAGIVKDAGFYYVKILCKKLLVGVDDGIIKTIGFNSVSEKAKTEWGI
jgi:hypothetical protein